MTDNYKEIGRFDVVEPGIGVLVIDNPPKNTIPKPSIIDIDILQTEIRERKIKGIIITGTGRHFSSGAEIQNIDDMAAQGDVLKEALLQGNNLLNFIENLKIPVVAAIEGACFGGGLEIALSAHIRVSSDKAFFSFPEVELSLLPGLGGIHRLAHICSPGKTLELVLSGEILAAEKGYKYHIIDHLVPGKQTFDFSLNLLQRMTQGRSLEIIHAIMESFSHYYTLDYNMALEEEVRIFCELAKRKITD
jgi:enoyl-CoA hydratase/carnithine racemase